MSESDTERFRANHAEFISGNPELENLVNIQAAGEYQSATELISPSPEQSIHATMESEQINENELELELFLHELRDNEFETMTHEMLQELEANFEGYAHQHGLSGESDQMHCCHMLDQYPWMWNQTELLYQDYIFYPFLLLPLCLLCGRHCQSFQDILGCILAQMKVIV